jgi:hypothetical protein
MCITKVAALGMLGVIAASGGQTELIGEPSVTVCIENSTVARLETLVAAKNMASQMFEKIGVRLHWKTVGAVPPETAIVVRLAGEAPVWLQPQTIARAQPYQGVNIIVYMDRLSWTQSRRFEPVLLAHVLVHEITHLLQASARHSESGVMKAHWTYWDRREMEKQPLPFTDYDVRLIHAGLKARARAGRPPSASTEHRGEDPK